MASDHRRKEQLPNLTEKIVQTYTSVGTINHLGHSPLPRSEVVTSIIEDLLEIIYPGYQKREGLHSGNIAYFVGDLIDGLHDKLTSQIARAFRHEDQLSSEELGQEETDFEAKGQAIAIAFLERIPDLREILATDVQAAHAGDPACTNLDEVIFCYPGLKAVTVYRLANTLNQLDVPFIPRMMTEWAHQETGIDIHPGATIGRYFFIDHGTGVVIGETCKIGEHVKLYQGVTLGAISFPTDVNGEIVREMKRHPTLEDRVVVYSNVSVLGGKTVIGHDSVIGANAWVTRSVAPQQTVTLEKPKLRIRSENNHELTPEANYQI
jgi:serine O-acetyltransferase